MSEVSLAEITAETRQLKVRMLRHAIEHLPGAIDPRTAMIAIRHGLLKNIPPSPIPDRILRIVENPADEARWPGSFGPFFIFRQGPTTRGMIELRNLLLNHDVRCRQAAIAEIDRYAEALRNNGELIMSPYTHDRIDGYRDALTSESLTECLGASVAIADLLDEDFFWQVRGLVQAAQFDLDEEFPQMASGLLSPKEGSLQFLVDLPVWSPKSQNDLSHLRSTLISRNETLSNSLSRYFRLFGHLPLAGELSAGDFLAAWLQGRVEASSIWDETWQWASDNGSPLARYHACCIFLQHVNWVPDGQQAKLLNACADVVLGGTNDKRWGQRCALAKHYCRHLETLGTNADGDRVAAMSWWLAEYLSCLFEGFGPAKQTMLQSEIDQATQISTEVWNIGRPVATPSSLRYATLFSRSMWGTSILCLLSNACQQHAIELTTEQTDVFRAALEKLPFQAIPHVGPTRAMFAFEGSTSSLAQRLQSAGTRSAGIDLIQNTITEARVDGGLDQLIAEFANAKPQETQAIAHELRVQAVCGNSTSTLFKLLADENRRRAMIVCGQGTDVEIILGAAIESAQRDDEQGWQAQLPHLIALATEQAEDNDRRQLLFAYTVSASIATNTVSAIERLLKNSQRGKYAEFAKQWRERIENVSPFAARWIGAKLRSIKSVLYVGG